MSFNATAIPVDVSSSGGCCCWITSIIFYTGLLVFIKLAFNIGYAINRGYFRKGYNLVERYGKDSWCLVTGATGGVGGELCKYAAEKGLNVIISGRNQEKLTKVEKEVQKEFPKVKTRTLRIDFNESQEFSYYEGVCDEVKDLDVSMLINNAALLHMAPYEDMYLQQVKDMMEANVFGVAVLTKIFLMRFLQRKNRSGIVNISSVGGIQPSPYAQFYSATKALVTSFTRALNKEVEDRVDVLTNSPCYIQTNMSNNSSGPHVATPRQVAHSIFRDVGYEIENHPTLVHEFQIGLLRTMQMLGERFTAWSIGKAAKGEMENQKKSH
jgi:17beta-estradiol 17-dehydrogenase / very-long-chain 3-oxoacyl-CoA reductase